MNVAQKTKIILVVCLLWTLPGLPLLPLATLPRVAAKPSRATPAQPTANTAEVKIAVSENYGKLPLSFEPNMGQSAKAVKFLSRGNGYTVFLSASEAVFSLRRDHHSPDAASRAVLRMTLAGANQDAPVQGQQPLPGKVNYLIGNDRNEWHTGIPTFRQVRYSNTWPGIDMVWYGTQNQLEYDFVIKPGCDVSQVRLSFAGADKLSVDETGNLLLQVNGEEMVQSAPVVYQDGDQGRVTVSGKYVLKSDHEVGFEVGPYDVNQPLVIDPILVYSSYIGGAAADTGLSVAVDSGGRAYLAGVTSSDEITFPIENAIQGSQIDTLGFVTKLNPAGDDVLYSTFLGDSIGFCTGNFCGTQINGIAVTSDGRAVVTGGLTNEDNDSKFPVTPNAYQRNGFCISWCGIEPNRMVDAFVTMLSADGSKLDYSTFYGGSSNYRYSERGFDIANAVAVDSGNRIYISGLTASNSLPTKHAFQWSRHSEGEGKDAFVAVFNPLATNGNDTLLYASYIGGDRDDIGRGIAVDADRNAYVVGSTASNDLETKSPSSLAPLRATFQGGATDGFVAKVDTTSDGDSSLTYSTYFGGNINDRVESVAVDSLQRAYITGASNSSASSFPLRNAFDSTQTNGEAFVAKLNADGTALFYSSFLGGDNGNTSSDGEEGLGITIDFGGNTYVTGRTTSGASFPAVLPLAANLQGTAFLTKIEATISNSTVPKVLYSTTFGGAGARGESVALDPKGNVYLGGTTPGTLPTTAGAFDTTFNGGTSDAFIAKFNTTFNDTIGVFTPATIQFQLRDSNSTGPADHLITFGQSGDQPITGDWNGSGTDQPGVFRPSTGQFLLSLGRKIIIVNFGQAGDVAVAGDWDGNGVDTPGVFNPATGQWLLTNGINGLNTANSFPTPNFTFTFGQNGDTPIVGDWDGNGIDGVGFFRGGNSTFFLSNGFQGTVDIKPFIFGSLGSKPLAGDWNGDGIATIGVFSQNTGVMALNNTNSPGNGVGDIVFNFGQNGDIPLAGDWDGKPSLP